MGPIQTLEDLFGLLRRRVWLIALITLAGMVLAALYAKSRPDIYESAAVIQVRQAEVSNRAEDLRVNPLVVMQAIEQRLTTRDNMIALIERHGLFQDLPGLSLEEKVALARASIRFQSVPDATGGSLSAILIVAQSDRPEPAARIANDLAQSVLDMGATDKRAAADATFAFFKAEEARLWQTLSALEAEIAAYREANRASLPSSREALQEEATAIDLTLREIDQEVAALQAEDARILTAEVLRATDRRRQEDIAQRLAVLIAQRAPLLARKTVLNESLARGAEVDRVMATYDRQQRQIQEQYTVVSQRLAEAETARRLAENQQSERFALLERAIEPEYPLGSGGKKIAIAGTFASAMLALGLAFLLDLLRPVLRTSAQMQREVNIRPIVAIPELRHSGKSRVSTKVAAQGLLPRLLGSRPPAQLAMVLGGGVLLVALGLLA
ncbi:MAG: Wzz/FepE/Etk N-terminal domain-containing protein [Cypionkella sp.]|nr:Wzz/FepE/Etk N-terminal domain-containing protein [Cypionkella sp.]